MFINKFVVVSIILFILKLVVILWFKSFMLIILLEIMLIINSSCYVKFCDLGVNKFVKILLMLVIFLFISNINVVEIFKSIFLINEF